MYASFRLRRDTFKNWWANNPLLALGEMVLVFRESENGRGVNAIDKTSRCIGYAIGDGIHYFRDLEVYVNTPVTKTTGELALGSKFVDSYTVSGDKATYHQLTGNKSVSSSDYVFAASGIGGGGGGTAASRNYFTELYLVTPDQMTTAGTATDYHDLEANGYVMKIGRGGTASDKLTLTAEKSGDANLLSIVGNASIQGSATFQSSATFRSSAEVLETLTCSGNVSVGGVLQTDSGISTDGNIVAEGTITASDDYKSVVLDPSGVALRFVNGSSTNSLSCDGSKITSTAYLYKA